MGKSQPKKFKGTHEIQSVNGQQILILRYGWMTLGSVLPKSFFEMDDRKQQAFLNQEKQALSKRLEWRIKQERLKLKIA